jgi:hypothetical protein
VVRQQEKSSPRHAHAPVLCGRKNQPHIAAMMDLLPPIKLMHAPDPATDKPLAQSQRHVPARWFWGVADQTSVYIKNLTGFRPQPSTHHTCTDVLYMATHVHPPIAPCQVGVVLVQGRNAAAAEVVVVIMTDHHKVKLWEARVIRGECRGYNTFGPRKLHGTASIGEDWICEERAPLELHEAAGMADPHALHRVRVRGTQRSIVHGGLRECCLKVCLAGGSVVCEPSRRGHTGGTSLPAPTPHMLQ